MDSRAILGMDVGFVFTILSWPLLNSLCGIHVHVVMACQKYLRDKKKPEHPGYPRQSNGRVLVLLTPVLGNSSVKYLFANLMV